jgi:hypothetical protein
MIFLHLLLYHQINEFNQEKEKPAFGPLRGTKIKNSTLRLKSAGEPSQRASQKTLLPTGGEGGIRTHGTL